jgi:5-methyltetrahydropteroyltriglutamate--homocysteine methyltransferase
MTGPFRTHAELVGRRAVDPDVVWAKFAAMAEGGRIASKRFWS